MQSAKILTKEHQGICNSIDVFFYNTWRQRWILFKWGSAMKRDPRFAISRLHVGAFRLVWASGVNTQEAHGGIQFRQPKASQKRVPVGFPGPARAGRCRRRPAGRDPESDEILKRQNPCQNSASGGIRTGRNPPFCKGLLHRAGNLTKSGPLRIRILTLQNFVRFGLPTGRTAGSPAGPGRPWEAPGNAYEPWGGRGGAGAIWGALGHHGEPCRGYCALGSTRAAVPPEVECESANEFLVDLIWAVTSKSTSIRLPIP